MFFRRGDFSDVSEAVCAGTGRWVEYLRVNWSWIGFVGVDDFDGDAPLGRYCLECFSDVTTASGDDWGTLNSCEGSGFAGEECASERS